MRTNIHRSAFLSFCSVIIGIALFVFPQSQTQVGYTLLTADSGSKIPVAAALFSYTNASGTLVSQAGVGAVNPIASGRIFVDQNEAETGFAFVNPSQQSAAISLVLRDALGSEVSRQQLTLDPGRHTARFVSEFFTNIGSGFNGSMTFESTQKLAAITLRQTFNLHGEPLYTTLPVVDLSKSPTSEPLLFPQIAAGEGYSTQVILINASAQKQRGTISLFAKDGRACPAVGIGRGIEIQL